MPGHLLISNEQWPATLSKDFLNETRSRLVSKGNSLKFIADDVSMGALREPMARLGVNIPRSDGPSMVEVEDLPLQWFEHLSGGGCDFFLIRGLPLGAFPAVGKTDPPPAMDQFVSHEEICFDGESYSAARQKITSDFASSADDLVSLDLARDDRWQVAGGLDATDWRRWDEYWDQCFGAVLGASGLDGPIAGEGSISRLLVTSHRPLPGNWRQSIWGKSLKSRLSGAGQCLLMGHPSLRAEFEPVLGREWEVTSLYDASCDVLGVSD